jgi:hypothetical protein
MGKKKNTAFSFEARKLQITADSNQEILDGTGLQKQGPIPASSFC